MTRRRLIALAVLVAWVALLGAVLAFAEIPESMDSSSIPSYRVVRSGLATGGQPSAETLKQLKAHGFKTVINLRSEAEGTADEQATVRGLSLRYVGVPVTPATFSLEDVRAVAEVLDDPDAFPVLLHCSSANCVGAVWAVLEVQRGKSREEAEKEAREIGLAHAPMIEAVARVLGGSPRP